MSALSEKMLRLIKAANLYGGRDYNHYLTGTLIRRGSAELPMYLMRAVMQLVFAFRMSQAQGGEFDDIVDLAAETMLSAYARDGACTRAEADKAEQILLPLAGEAKKYKVHMVSHAHIDMNWQWPYHETAAITLETFRTVLNFMREFPGFTYSQSQASTYEIVEKFEPEMLEEIKRRVKEGRWEVSACTWVEADKNMPTAESMARHLLYTKNYLSKTLGIDPDELQLDYEPDTFGHSANVPEVLNQGGVKYYYYCRGRAGGGAHLWRSPSGAEVLAYQEPTWYLGDVNPNFAMYAPEFYKTTGLYDSIKVYGVGDHGGGPTRQDLAYIEEMKTWPVFPRLEYSSYRAFFDELSKARERLPVVEGELNCVFSGCYTTQCRVKAANRAGEQTLFEAEALSAGASLLTGRAYRAKAFEAGWRRVLFSQFHDILPGSGVRDTREYALATFSETMAYAGTEYAGALRALAGAIDTSMVIERGADSYTRSEGAGVGFESMRFRPPVAERGAALTRVFHAFNPLPVEKEGAVELTVWDYPGDLSRLRARDLSGKDMPLQVLGERARDHWGHTYARALTYARIPSFGWTTIVLDEAPDEFPLVYPRDPRVHAPDSFALENERVKCVFDSQNGMLVSFIDKLTGAEMLSAPAGFFEILEDSAKGMTSWVVGRYIRREPITKDVRLKHKYCGSLRKSITLETRFGTLSTLQCEISLDEGASHLAFKVPCDWRERGTKQGGMTQLAFAAPLAYSSERGRYDIPAGTIDRAGMELDVPMTSFACALNEGGAPALVITSDAKYGARLYDSTLQMTLIRAGFDPDPDPENGLHEFCVALGVARDQSPAALASQCLRINRPFSCITARPHAGKLPGAGELMRLEAENARVSGVKLAEDGRSLVVRITNYGESERARIICIAPIKTARLSNALEAPGYELPIADGACALTLGAHALTTVRLDF